MNSKIQKSMVPFGAVVVAALFLLLSVITTITSSVTRADDGKQTSSGRLITIHDLGIEKVILTQTKTVGDALKEADITINEKDAVEPAVTEKLVASDYQVNIYRARPVVIIDGNVRTRVSSPYQTASQIANSAGIELFDEDIVTVDRVADIVSEGVGLQLTIKRATPFTLTLFGKSSIIRTQAKTVEKMLAEKGIKLGVEDRTSLPLNSEITDGTTVRIWREGKQTVVVDEEINYEVEKIEDIDQEVTYKLIKTPGEKGARSVTYEITVQDGVETGRVEIASIITAQPKKQIEIVGAKGQYNTPSENETIVWDFLISKGYSRVQTAGIMGNLMQEHRFNTTGDGLAQWVGGRKAELYSMPYPNNIYTQLEFLVHELDTNYGFVGTEIKAANFLPDVVNIFQNKYEKCGACMESNRLEYARNILASH